MVLSLRRFTLYCLLQQVDKGVWLIDPPSGRDQHIIRDGDIGGRYHCNVRPFLTRLFLRLQLNTRAKKNEITKQNKT
ncbi:Uncharacterized protein APZ42_003547, partial [Daphnia magna]